MVIKKKSNKRRDLVQLLLSIVIIILLNFIGFYVFHRFDLTEEKRYTLSNTTKNLLKDLNDVVYVKVYLEGDFPGAPGFKRLRDGTKEMLDEFRAYANDNIEYEFIDPAIVAKENGKKDFYKELYDKGIAPTNLQTKGENGTASQQVIFPGAIVTFKGREMPVQLLQQETVDANPDVILNNSIEALEYEFSNAIRKLTVFMKPSIAFIQGHGELDSLHIADIQSALSEYYEVKSIRINEKLKSLTYIDTTPDGNYKFLNKYKAIVIAKPDTAFSEKDKFIIDQFVMRGGKVLWLIDPLFISVDSLKTRGATMAIPLKLNIEDQLFKYGARINNNLILDLQSSYIPVNRAAPGANPKWQFEPWFFNPLIGTQEGHGIVKNIELIKFDYVSTIDTIQVKNVAKTILLQSSKYSKVLNAPVRVDLRMVNIQPKEEQFRNSFQPVAVLLEGKFQSLFKNRIPPSLANDKKIGFIDTSQATKMIVVSDGDVIRNEVQLNSLTALPLGYDVYTRRQFGNKTFILNCINYLCDDIGMISVRAREIKLRLLDKKKLIKESSKWQIINIVLPILLIVVYGIIQFYIRRKKYSSQLKH